MRDSDEVRQDESQQRGRQRAVCSGAALCLPLYPFVYPSPYVPALTDGHEPRVATERTSSKRVSSLGQLGKRPHRDAARGKVFPPNA